MSLTQDLKWSLEQCSALQYSLSPASNWFVTLYRKLLPLVSSSSKHGRRRSSLLLYSISMVWGGTCAFVLHKDVKSGESALHAILLSHIEGVFVPLDFLFLWLCRLFLAACYAFFTCTYIMPVFMLWHGKCMATEISTVCAERIQRYNNSPSMSDHETAGHRQSLTRWSKKGPYFPF